MDILVRVKSVFMKKFAMDIIVLKQKKSYENRT